MKLNKNVIFFKFLINFKLKHLNDNKSKKRISKKNITDLFSKINKNYWPFSKIAGKFAVWYLIAIIIGAVFLASPICLSPKGKGFDTSRDFRWDFLTSFFTASSSFSDTGLNLLNVSDQYNFFGQLVILILIQFGGFGILTFKVIFFLFIGKKITLKDKLLVKNERGSSTIGGTIELIKVGFLFLIFVEFISFLLLFPSFYFYKIESGVYDNEELNNISYHNYSVSLWVSIFHAISAINNAGFDIIGNNSFVPYNKAYLIQTILILDFVLGGIGFPTFNDIYNKIKFKIKKKNLKLSLFTKLNLITYFIVSTIGLLIVFFIEFTSNSSSSIYLSSKNNYHNHLLDFITMIFFNVMSTRNAGFSTTNFNDFQDASKYAMSIMMFIGSAPSSTAGGIRTTTLSVIVLTIISVIKNDNIISFKRSIPLETVKRAFSIFSISLFLIFFFSLFVSTIEPNIKLINIIFILNSAFGTTGLSTIDINGMINLTAISKVLIIILMIIGQIGISNTLLMFKTKYKKQYKKIEEDIQIG